VQVTRVEAVVVVVVIKAEAGVGAAEGANRAPFVAVFDEWRFICGLCD
jgi:hypothetical protein